MPAGRSDLAGAAVGAAVTGRRAWGREIVAILCFKAAALGLLYLLFFAAADRSAVSDRLVAGHLLTMPRSGPGDEVRDDR